MKDLRIVFMGTPDFAVASLKALVEENYQIVGVITAPDKPAGRGRKLQQSAVKQYALEEGLRVMQPTNLKSSEFLEELQSVQADLQIVVAFRMLPKVVWSMPKYGTFNLHASLLPDYRGAAPINWAIINGETKTGVSTFFLNEEIDTGAIILQREVEINEEDSAGDLHDTLMNIGSEAVIETVKLIQDDKIEAIAQQNGDFKDAPKLNKENCRINWNSSLSKIHNHIRGLNPYPAAWTKLENQGNITELKIYGGKMIDEKHDLPIGTIVTTKKTLRVSVTNGFYEILDLKVAGKRRMDASSLLNGYEFHNGAKLF